jgi:hypothetical protein
VTCGNGRRSGVLPLAKLSGGEGVEQIVGREERVEQVRSLIVRI